MIHRTLITTVLASALSFLTLPTQAYETLDAIKIIDHPDFNVSTEICDLYHKV